MGTPAAGGPAASTGLLLFKSKSLCPVFIKLGEYVGMHNISTKFYNQPNPPGTPELWPLNCPKTEKAVSALQVEYPAPQNLVITTEFTTNTMGVFVSVWHSCLSLSKQRTSYCKGVCDCAMSLFSVFHFDRVQKNVFSCDDCGFTDSS